MVPCLIAPLPGNEPYNCTMKVIRAAPTHLAVGLHYIQYRASRPNENTIEKQGMGGGSRAPLITGIAQNREVVYIFHFNLQAAGGDGDGQTQ